MKKPMLHKTPILVAWILLILGILSTLNLMYLPLLIREFDGMDGGFALIAGGIFLLIFSGSIFYYYGRLNKQFQKMFCGQALLAFVLPRSLYSSYSNKQAEEIKAGNTAVLFTIFAFCLLFGVIFALTIDPLFLLICLCIAVFFTAVYFIVTAYRTKKVKRSQALVLLSEGGIYAYGQHHSWSVPGAKLSAVTIDTGPTLPCPCIRITYAAVTYPALRTETVTVPVPASLLEKAAQAVESIRKANGQ